MKKLSLLSLAFAAACTSQTAGNQTGHLQANADARHAGVYSYVVSGDEVSLRDEHGMELGLVRISSETPIGRTFEAQFVDGTKDEVDVNRPIADGRFVAPNTPETALTASLADPALASLWAAHGVRFTLFVEPRLGAAVVDPSDAATTASCSSYACGQSCSPAGCAKPANTSVGCTNPTALPATITSSATWQPLNSFDLDTDCNTVVQADCLAAFGGAAKDWTLATAKCVYLSHANTWVEKCAVGTSGNSWVASCPPSVCTAPNYDAVPRNGACNSPGSCSYSQGTVTCTTYH